MREPNLSWCADAINNDIKSLEAVEFQCDTCEHNCDADCHADNRCYPCGQQHCWHSIAISELLEELDALYREED